MYRTQNCGALRIDNIGTEVILSGWMSKSRDLGGLTFIDLRDRYGTTQLVFNMDNNKDLCEQARKLGREFVLQVKGIVRERSSKNPEMPTGDVEIEVTDLQILNEAKLPPFIIADETDGGDELRMKYRYLDIRRRPVTNNLIFRSKLAIETRKYLDSQGFIEVETPCLIKSTPEGARDFIVPSRMNPGEAYALPQSPQTFKQILMVAGMDRYFQIVKCFRDEDLRADRQPEFTQIDCEMAFVTQEEVLHTFEGLTKHVFSTLLGVELPDFRRMTYQESMTRYGSDKPDLRFGMEIHDLSEHAQDKGFKVFDSVETVAAIRVEGQSTMTRKQLDGLTEWIKRPQIGAKGLVYVKCNEDDSFKSSVDKFFEQGQLADWAHHMDASAGDLLLVMAGEDKQVRRQLGELRLHMADMLELRQGKAFEPLWVVDFPLLEWDEEEERFFAMHHPFTSPKPEDMEMMQSSDRNTLESLRANAYDLVINGAEIGGGSIRIHDRDLQSRNFKLLGFTAEEAEEQFGFLLNAFEYGAPPHGGIAFGFDRLCAVMNHQHSIRDFIAFPKNNQGRDVMIDAPAAVTDEQLKELHLAKVKEQAK